MRERKKSERRPPGPAGFALFDGPRLLATECGDAEAFERSFGTEDRCVEWLRSRRWPRGFMCPGCAGSGPWVAERRGYQCSRCRKFTSVTAGTILHGTQKPLRKWFEALFLVVQRGVNARTLQREIGLTYKVAWMWGHKLRSLLAAHAMPEVASYEAERERGGPRARLPRAGAPGPCGCSKLVAQDWSWVDDPKPPSRFVWTPPETVGLDPRRLDVWAHWELLATYWGSLTEKHLRSYLDELAFRSNRRKRAVAESFLAVAPELFQAGPRPWREIVAKAEPAEGAKPVSIFAIRPRPSSPSRGPSRRTPAHPRGEPPSAYMSCTST
ncbi:MAG: transposase [Planctomycetota bacterium]